MIIDKLIKFAKANYPGFAELPDNYLKAWFTVYQDTTLVNIVDGKIKGFALYQEWPDRLNFICICGSGNWIENLQAMLKGCQQLPAKPICFYDETEHRLRIFQR